MKILTTTLLCIATVLVGGCASTGNSTEIPGAISTHDLNQADYLKSWLSQVPEIKDRFSVTPGSENIIVKFKDDLPAGRTAIFTERLTQLKAEMQQKMNKPINTLVFEFPSQTIKI